MFFEEDPSPKCSDPLFDKLPEKNLRFLCKTRKVINVEHAYITPKEGKQGLFTFRLNNHLAIFYISNIIYDYKLYFSTFSPTFNFK